MPEVVFHPRAVRYFEKLDHKQQGQIKAKLAELERNPRGLAGVVPMQGAWKGFFRFRQGNLRVIYYLDDSNDQITVARIGPRGDVYK